MALITDYSSLQDAIADFLNRDDLTSVIPQFIQLAEQKFLRDKRLRKFQNAGDFNITADDLALPSDFMALDSWYLDSDNSARGYLDVVTLTQLSGLKARYGASGVPVAVAILPDKTARFAPSPDQTYTSKLTYWRTLTPLSDSNTINWLLDDSVDVYLYGALVEAAYYLKDDSRLPLFMQLREAAIAERDFATQNLSLGGGPIAWGFRSFGG